MKNQINKWHLAIICVTTIILALSALPTFYGKQSIVSIQAVSEDTDLPSISMVKESLKGKVLTISNMRATDNQIFIQPSSKNVDLTQIREKLLEDFGQPYAIYIDEIETSPRQAAKIIGSTATLDVFQLSDSAQGGKRFKSKQGQNITVNNRPVFSGHNIQSAAAGRDQNGMPLVNLVLDSQGGEKMSRFSKAHIGEAMVSVFSEYQSDSEGSLKKHSKVINIATIQSHLGNRFSITNMPSAQAAQELAMLIRAGSLNAPVSIIEQRTIDPSLGEENVHSGYSALLLGLAITLTFMGLWYRKLGLIANTSLVINLLCLLGLMAWLPGVVLTLPGIAGLVLTIGMAVDTNVLIFERIKHQALQNRTPAAAIESGYQRALTTILDANITTMICALILFSIGNGPVKGFAITLSLGLITSMFSGVFVAKFLSRLFPAHSLIRQQEVLK